MQTVIQIARSKISSALPLQRLKRLREHFDRCHYVRVPGILEPRLLEYARRELKDAPFFKVTYETVGTELCMRENTLDGMFLFLLNDPYLFDLAEKITGCGRIRSFVGRMYRFIPGEGHHDSWHEDTMESRVLAVSINLSPEIYQGGILQIRNKKTGKIVSRVVNTGFGDSIFFRLADSLEHRLSEVKGKVPKTAFAGWFSSKPVFSFHFERKKRWPCEKA